jgi:type I site-specific restriction endonuclease
VKHEHDYELMFQRSYKHMLGRMKKDLIAIKIEATEQQASFKQKQQIVGQEQDGSRKSKEQRMQAKHKLDALMKEIDLEQRNRQERIQSLQKSIQNKEEALKRRMERVRRQQEIAESAANENKDSNELKMQHNYMVQRLWSQFLKKKMDKEMKRTFNVEEAFQKIKSATGYTDVQDIVQKFLTREQTYSQLLMAVSDYERKIDALRKDNEFYWEELHEL